MNTQPPATVSARADARLALANRIEKHSLGWIKQVEGEVSGCSELDACLLEEEEAMIADALRLAATPSDEVREAMIEECAKAAHGEWFAGNRHRYASELGPAIEAKIRALSTKAKP